MPDLTDEMLMEFKPLPELAHTDLHMGAAQVKPVSKPSVETVDLTSIAVNAITGAGYLALAWLFVQVWAWVLFS